MKYCEFHSYDAALPHAYVYEMARTVTCYALCFNFLPAYCIVLPERSKTWLLVGMKTVAVFVVVVILGMAIVTSCHEQY